MKFFDDQPLGASISDLTPKYRVAKHPKIARSILAAGIIMPTERLMTKMAKKGFRDFAELEAGIEDMPSQSITLINDTENFMVEYPTMGAEDVLDLMESFDSVVPLSVKYGEIVFLCNCKGAYHSYVCLESAVLSCMFNPELEIPDIAWLKQLKVKIKDKKKAEVQEARKWQAIIPVYT